MNYQVYWRDWHLCGIVDHKDNELHNNEKFNYEIRTPKLNVFSTNRAKQAMQVFITKEHEE